MLSVDGLTLYADFKAVDRSRRRAHRSRRLSRRHRRRPRTRGGGRVLLAQVTSRAVRPVKSEPAGHGRRQRVSRVACHERGGGRFRSAFAMLRMNDGPRIAAARQPSPVMDSLACQPKLAEAVAPARPQASEGWRKRLGVEPSPPAERGATGFEDREGHRAPFASGPILPLKPPADTQPAWTARRTSGEVKCGKPTPRWPGRHGPGRCRAGPAPRRERATPGRGDDGG